VDRALVRRTGCNPLSWGLLQIFRAICLNISLKKGTERELFTKDFQFDFGVSVMILPRQGQGRPLVRFFEIVVVTELPADALR